MVLNFEKSPVLEFQYQSDVATLNRTLFYKIDEKT
jgi:hypothetical protein